MLGCYYYKMGRIFEVKKENIDNIESLIVMVYATTSMIFKPCEK